MNPSRGTPVFYPHFDLKAAQRLPGHLSLYPPNIPTSWASPFLTTPHLEEGSWAKLGTGRDAHVPGTSTYHELYPRKYVSQQAVARPRLEDVELATRTSYSQERSLAPGALSLSSPPPPGH